jgi:hypothetical protein
VLLVSTEYAVLYLTIARYIQCYEAQNSNNYYCGKNVSAVCYFLPRAFAAFTSI